MRWLYVDQSNMHESRDLPGRLGARIKELRTERRLSQEEVAAHVGISQPTWSRIERTGNVSAHQLLRLQALLELETLESFFGELPSRRVGREKESSADSG